MVDFRDIIEHGLMAYRLHGVRTKKKPSFPDSLNRDYPSPKNVKFDQLSEHIGIPGYELEILWDFLISDKEISHQLSDIFLQAKLAYDGSLIHDKKIEFDELKKNCTEQYQCEYLAWSENQSLSDVPDRELEVALRELIAYAKKFDPGAPATAAMVGIVYSIALCIDRSYSIFNHAQYASFLKEVDWAKVDEAILLKKTDAERQKVFSNAKGKMCQMDKIFYPSEPAEVLLLPIC